ncbi:MAG: hypothetical protein HY644_06790 [Acidobacteria bacterium]|nr:hypothetical protein [Acidobacteriota bacterium]
MHRKAKIIATVGPACSSPERLRKLIRAGVDVFRLNFSHGTHQSHRATVRNIRRISAQLHIPVGIMQDLQGPKIRTGATEGGNPIELKAGKKLVITTYHASNFVKARYIIAFTQSGATANLIAKYRPGSRVLAFTPYEEVVRRLKLTWGVTPMRMLPISNVDELIGALEKELLTRKLARRGDRLAILTGAPILERGHTSLLKLHEVKG